MENYGRYDGVPTATITIADSGELNMEETMME